MGPDQLQAALNQINFADVAAMAADLIAGMAAVFSDMLFLLLVVAFMALDATGFSRRLARAKRQRPNMVIVAYSVINFILQSVIQPKILADAVNLSLTLTFLSMVFWTFVIGPIGALLAVPLTLLAKALLLDADPTTRWISARRRPSAARGPGRRQQRRHARSHLRGALGPHHSGRGRAGTPFRGRDVSSGETRRG